MNTHVFTLLYFIFLERVQELTSLRLRLVSSLYQVFSYEFIELVMQSEAKGL